MREWLRGGLHPLRAGREKVGQAAEAPAAASVIPEPAEEAALTPAAAEQDVWKELAESG